jgi:hypothetical protein
MSGEAQAFSYAVVIPAYNRANVIGETIERVLAQTLPPAEVAVVDDGSTDGTAEAAARFGARVRVHRRENGGPGCARNTGVRLTSAPWIAFCDSDDLWLPEKMEMQMELHRRRPEIPYSFTDLALVREGRWSETSKFAERPEAYWAEGRNIEDGFYWIYQTPLYARILTGCLIIPSTVVVAREFFERIGGFYEPFSRSRAEDWEFALRCAEHPRAGAVARPLVGLRKHDSNYSASGLLNLLGEILVLEYARSAHRSAAAYVELIERRALECRVLAAHESFRLFDFERVRRLVAEIPRERRDFKLAVKHRIACWPESLARFAAGRLVAISDRMQGGRHTG